MWIGTSGPAPVYVVQIAAELGALLDALAQRPPRAVLEIGSERGGTLWHWMQAARPGATIVSLSLDADQWSAPWEGWARQRGQILHVYAADSADPDALGAVGALGPYDLIFIDGDHSYEAAARDWQTARRVAAPGALVAFHDITPHAADPSVGVWRLWDEIAAAYGPSAWSYIAQPGVAGGIGVVQL